MAKRKLKNEIKKLKEVVLNSEARINADMNINEPSKKDRVISFEKFENEMNLIMDLMNAKVANERISKKHNDKKEDVYENEAEARALNVGFFANRITEDGMGDDYENCLKKQKTFKK
ncbi:hypothetical protein COBT_002055 [Conglomerata obtusa]